MLFRGFFLTRRFLLFVVIFFNRAHVGIQIVLVLYINLAIFLFQGMTRPFNQRSFNSLELLNETLITYAFYCFTAFTDFVSEIETQTLMGYFILLIILILILFNMSIICYIVVRNLNLILIKYYRILEKKLDNCDERLRTRIATFSHKVRIQMNERDLKLQKEVE